MIFLFYFFYYIDNFIIFYFIFQQGGGKACSTLHSAKAVCKRVERNVAFLVQDGLLNKEAQIYLNKLQNFLLTTSRIAAKCDQRTENIYIPRVEVEKNEEK